MLPAAAVSDEQENAAVSVHPLGKSARITRAATALRDISNTVHVRDRAASGLTARDKPSQLTKRGQPDGRDDRLARTADDHGKDVVAPLPSMHSSDTLSPFDFASVSSSTPLSSGASTSFATVASTPSTRSSRARRTSLSTTNTTSSGNTHSLASTAASFLPIDVYADSADRPLSQREVAGLAIGDSGGSSHGRLSDISTSRRPPVSSLTLPHILTNRLSATTYIELTQRRLASYLANNRDLARDNAQLQAHAKQHSHERKVMAQRAKQLTELLRIYKGRVDEGLHELERRDEERQRERMDEEKERAKVEERQRRREAEMRALRDGLDKMREELRDEKRLRREEASGREEEDRVRMERSSGENDSERMLGVQVKQSIAEVQRLQRRVDELLQEKEQADGREEQLRRDSARQADESDRERQQLHSDIKDKAQQLQQTSDARDKAMSELTVLTDELSSNKLIADELADRVQHLQDSNEQLQVRLQQLEEMRETYASQSEHVQRLAAQLAESEQARDELSQQLDDYEVELAVTKEELEGTEDAYRQLNSGYGKLRQVVVELSEQLKSVRAAMAGMRDEEQARQQVTTSAQQLHQLLDTRQHAQPTQPTQSQLVGAPASSHATSPASTGSSSAPLDEQEELCELWAMQLQLDEAEHKQSSGVPLIAVEETVDGQSSAGMPQRVGMEVATTTVEVEDENEPLN